MSEPEGVTGVTAINQKDELSSFSNSPEAERGGVPGKPDRSPNQV